MKTIISFSKSLTYSGDIEPVIELFKDYESSKENMHIYTKHFLKNDLIGKGFKLEIIDMPAQEPMKFLGKTIQQEKEPTIYFNALINQDKKVKKVLKHC